MPRKNAVQISHIIGTVKTAPVHHPGFTAKLRNGRGRGRNIRRTSQFHNWAINRTAVGLALCPVCVLVVARRRLCDSSVFRALRTDNGIQAKQRPRNCHPRHDGATRSGALNWGLSSLLPPSNQTTPPPRVRAQQPRSCPRGIGVLSFCCSCGGSSIIWSRQCMPAAKGARAER